MYIKVTVSIVTASQVIDAAVELIEAQRAERGDMPVATYNCHYVVFQRKLPLPNKSKFLEGHGGLSSPWVFQSYQVVAFYMWVAYHSSDSTNSHFQTFSFSVSDSVMLIGYVLNTQVKFVVELHDSGLFNKVYTNLLI